jgi:c-di-GMP-binding flagellar brake protein YcgR
VENSKALSPLAKADLEIGKSLPFSIFDRDGKLLLAEGQPVSSQRQLEELASKGMCHNPRWVTKIGAQLAAKSPTDTTTTVSKVESALLPRILPARLTTEDPFETGSYLKMSWQGQSKNSFPVRLIGSIGRLAVLVTHPMQDGKCVFVKEGQICDFQTTFGVSIYRFSSMIEKVLLSPNPLLVISWPHDTHYNVKVVRRQRRVNCDLPATIRLDTEKSMVSDSFSVVVGNISTGGVEVLSAKILPLHIGQCVLIAFQIILEDRKYLVECMAEVVSRQTDPTAYSFTYSFSFKELTDEQFSTVHAYVVGLLNSRLSPPIFSRSE